MNNLDQDNITPTEKPKKEQETVVSNNSTEKQEERVRKDFKGFLESLKRFLSELFDIRNNTDPDAAKQAIIADIPFKGHTTWILICSIFIASVGLNANSTAVVIGAMLISPLMGPILGIGLSIGINDLDTLKRSLKNFGVMVVFSVLTAYLFFRFFPLQVESSELLARTEPDIRDVLIAFFGGLALVIARAKKGTIASVIFGVAIATALMPPLCTVGFGLAIGNYGYATGAMYLFVINTIFIALATFLVIKVLGFPMVRYVNSKKRRRIARLASLIALAVMIPAGIAFYRVFQKSMFMRQANNFVHDKIAPYKFKENGRLLDNLTEIHYDNGQNPSIEVVFMGNELIPDNIINTWQDQMTKDYPRLKSTQLTVVQGGQSDDENELKYVNELYESQKTQLSNKDERIAVLESEVNRLRQVSKMQIPFEEISKEAKTNYEDISHLGYAFQISTDFEKTDSIPVFEVSWKNPRKTTQNHKNSEKLQEWLKLRLKNDKIKVKEVAEN